MEDAAGHRDRPGLWCTRPLIGQLLRGVVVALIAVVGLELLLRVGDDGVAAPDLAAHVPARLASGMLVEHPTRLFALRGKRRAAHAHAGRYACEGWPYRGRPPALDPSDPWPKDVQYVLVLGDECVFGSGVDVDQTLPAALERRLIDRGLAPTGLQVVNLGVPSYSIVQTGRLLEETLEVVRPAAVVLYPGAWNDQHVAIGPSDVALDSRAHSLMSRSAIASRIRSALPTTETDQSIADRRIAAFEAGSQSVPRRVPLDAYRRQLERIARACRDAGCQLIAVTPAHPAETVRRIPAVRAYAEETSAWARSARLALVDGSGVLNETGLGDEALFIDRIQPSPPALEALAAAVAEHVEVEIDAQSPGLSGGAWSLSTAAVSALGDEWIELEAPGSLAPDAPVLVCVGNAPLLDVGRTESGAVRGRTMANAAGRYPVLAWTSGRWESTGLELELVSPGLAFSAAPKLQVVATGRPGDRFLLEASSARLETPDWTIQGPRWLDRSSLVPDLFELTCNVEGTATLDLEPYRDEITTTLFAQALVLPREVLKDEALMRATDVIVVAKP